MVRSLVVLSVAIAATQCAIAQTTISQPTTMLFDGIPESVTGVGSTAYPDGDYYEQLSAAGGQGPMCCDDDWGCGGSPFRTGPGCGDHYRVGPRWRILLDGLMMYREKTDLAPLATAIGTTLDDADQYENFGHGGGVRLLATAFWPQCKNYEVAIGYTGVEEWNANVVAPVVVIPPVVGPPASVAVDERRTLNYNSSLHSLEVNFQAVNNIVWKPYAGIRYFSFDENIQDLTRQYPSAPLVVSEQSITNTRLHVAEVDNNLIGFQIGVRRDLWKVARKVYIQGFANAGMYCNLINRDDVIQSATTNTEILEDDPDTGDIDETGFVESTTTTTGNRVKTERTRVSFAGEAALTLVWKFNNCCALRSGYEVLVVNGVELADDAFLGNVQSRDMVFHGAFAGFEYRR